MTLTKQSSLNLAAYLHRRASFHLSNGNAQRAADLQASAVEYERQAEEAR